MVEEYKRRIIVLEALKAQCIDAEIKIVGRQDDDLLIELLDKEYPRLFSPVKNQILSLLDGKKDLTKVAEKERVRLENQLKGNCYLNNINPTDKTGKLLPFNKISTKITKEINLLIKERQEITILDLFKKK